MPPCHCALGGTRAAVPFSPTGILRGASDKLLVTKPNASCPIDIPAVPKRRIESEHFAQTAFHHLLIRALTAAIEPRLELADADGVLGRGLLDADAQSGCGAKEHARESEASILAETT